VKISCPTCAAKYSVADEKIQSRLAKIRCRKCSSTIVIDGTASPARVYIGDASAVISASGPPYAPGANEAGVSESFPSAARLDASAPAPAASDSVGPAPDEYAVDIADNDQRNMTIHQIIGAYNEGLISADTYIWKEGMADWQTLAEVRDVADALRAAARPVAATPAAVRRPDQGTTPDLFGRIHTAGSEDDITTSAPEPMPALTAGTGARNESSVLFSLSALTGTAGPTSSSSAAPKRGRDDSGLIDLHALTAAAEAAGPGGGFSAPSGAFGASPLISAPLGSGAAPLGGGMLQGYGQRSGSRLNLIIAILLLAVGIIGGAAFVVNRGNSEAEQQALRDSKKEANPSALTQEPAAAAPKAVEPASDHNKAAEDTSDGKPSTKPEAVAPPPITPKELPSAAPEPAAAPKPAPHPQIVRISKPAPRSSVSPLPPAPMPTLEPPAPKPAPKPTAEAAAGEPKKKSVPACICKPADLLCAMKCSAGKK
jgi:predicted Zn finger-like uncharacterized protein